MFSPPPPTTPRTAPEHGDDDDDDDDDGYDDDDYVNDDDDEGVKKRDRIWGENRTGCLAGLVRTNMITAIMRMCDCMYVCVCGW